MTARIDKCSECGGNCDGDECGTHAAGCVYGGFSCGYWLIAEGCTLSHWEEHYVGDDQRCPCGIEFPGAPRGVTRSKVEQ